MEAERIPDWLLERLAAGDLPEADAQALQQRLDAEPDGLARLDAIRASNEAILAAHPPARVAAAIRERAGEKARRFNPLSLALAAPALAVFLLVYLAPGTDGIVQLPPEEIRLKGAEPQLLVYRQRADAPERLAAGAEVRARDLLQLSYQAAAHDFGVVLSVDGRGDVILHLPDGGATAARLQPGGAVALPQAYELDDAPAFERFFFISSDAPFSVENALEAARWLAQSADPTRLELPLPPSLHQTSVVVKKVP